MNKNVYLYGLTYLIVYSTGWLNCITYNLCDSPKQELTAITLRDWYAGMALSGMYAADTPGNYIPMEKRVREAYYAADQMIKAANAPVRKTDP